MRTAREGIAQQQVVLAKTVQEMASLEIVRKGIALERIAQEGAVPPGIFLCPFLLHYSVRPFYAQSKNTFVGDGPKRGEAGETEKKKKLDESVGRNKRWMMGFQSGPEMGVCQSHSRCLKLGCMLVILDAQPASSPPFWSWPLR